MNEYIIVNKTGIQKRIEELENKRDDEHKKGHDKSALRYENTILELKQILSQSAPLIPEIEDAFDAGVDWQEGGTILYPDKNGYIKNLKLDI